jgi:[amino group carrier protein]-L-2-aminoadipate 6-kinase
MIVVKIGGGKEINYDLVLKDLINYGDILLVHGGNHELSVLSEKLGKKQIIVTSASGIESRLTDRETIDIMTMTYCGKINKMIVEKLQKLGKNALGLSGIDGKLLMGKRKDALIVVENGKKRIIRDDLSGKPEKVNVELIKLLMQNNYLPVITPPALSYENDAINVDGDRAAAVIAGSLNAEALIILSNVPGLLENPKDEKTLVKHINREDIAKGMDIAKGRMKKKIMGAIEALDLGVKKVIFSDARIENPITRALEGEGTIIE